MDGEAQAETAGGEDGAGALSAAGLAATAATVTLRRLWAAQGVRQEESGLAAMKP